MKEEEIFKTIMGYHDLSYKYWKRYKYIGDYSSIDKPKQNFLLYRLKLARLNCPFPSSYDSLTYEKYKEFTGRGENLKYLWRKPPTMRQLKKELRFRGFIPISEYQKEINEKFDYIQTNQPIDGEYWIYPEKLSSCAKYINKRKRGRMKYTYEAFEEIAFPGFTRIVYSNLNSK